MSLEKVLEVARGELGVTESPAGSNRVKYWDLFGPGWQGQPWCVAFLAWVFEQAGERMAFFGGGKTASCGTLLRWYKEQGLTAPVSDVQVGDIVILNFHGTQDTEHCGLVVDVTSNVADGLYKVQTIEGNTSEYGSQDNGGCVAKKTRYPSEIVAVCRPQYREETAETHSSTLPEEPKPVDDVTGHWAADSITRARERGLMKGYPDGSFQPDKPVTRAEVCVILDRFYRMMIEEDDAK